MCKLWITTKKEGIFSLGPILKKWLYELVLKVEKKKVKRRDFLTLKKLWITMLM